MAKQNRLAPGTRHLLLHLVQFEAACKLNQPIGEPDLPRTMSATIEKLQVY